MKLWRRLEGPSTFARAGHHLERMNDFLVLKQSSIPSEGLLTAFNGAEHGRRLSGRLGWKADSHLLEGLNESFRMRLDPFIVIRKGAFHQQILSSVREIEGEGEDSRDQQVLGCDEHDRDA